MARIFKSGQRVLLSLPTDARTTFRELMKHDGEIFTVSRVKFVKERGVTKYYYELDNFESKKGVPYGVLPEWLHEQISE